MAILKIEGSGSPSLWALPPELMVQVFQGLNLKEVTKVRQVCKAFAFIIDTNKTQTYKNTPNNRKFVARRVAIANLELEKEKIEVEFNKIRRLFPQNPQPLIDIIETQLEKAKEALVDSLVKKLDVFSLLNILGFLKRPESKMFARITVESMTPVTQKIIPLISNYTLEHLDEADANAAAELQAQMRND